MKTPLLKARVSKIFKERVAEYCKERGLTESEVIRNALDRVINDKKKDNKDEPRR